jgi:hypothetical protein
VDEEVHIHQLEEIGEVWSGYYVETKEVNTKNWPDTCNSDPTDY